MNGAERRRPLEHDLELRGHARKRMIQPLLLQQVMDRLPVHVAIEHGADDAAVEHVLECLVMRLRYEVADHVRVGRLVDREAADAKALRGRRTAAEATSLRCE